MGGGLAKSARSEGPIVITNWPPAKSFEAWPEGSADTTKVVATSQGDLANVFPESHGALDGGMHWNEKSEPLTPARLAKTIPEVQRWDATRFHSESKLQDALRNQGTVVQMTDQQAQGEFARVAVKKMPNDWVRRNPAEFASVHATATERPWQDLGCVQYLNNMRYPYACRLLGIFRDEEVTYVVASLATVGDLFAWCEQDPPPGQARLGVIRPVCAQIVGAVGWLHELGIVHRDLSLENILLTEVPEGQQVKLIDFGMSTLRRWSKREVRGKQSYQAPEMHGTTEYDGFLTDAFALGVTIYCMAVKDYPWLATRQVECKCFAYVYTYGLRSFCEQRKLRRIRGLPQSNRHIMDTLNEPFFELLAGLTHLSPSSRLTLGEECWAEHDAPRRSVWDLQWLQGCEEPDGMGAASKRQGIYSDIQRIQTPEPCQGG